MTDQSNDKSDRTPTPDEQSFNQAPKVLSNTTLAVAAVAVLFLIVAGLLFAGFFSTGGR